MNQTQNITLGHGVVNNGTIVVNPVEVSWEPPAPARPLPPAPHGLSWKDALVRSVNFVAWSLLASAAVAVAVAVYGIMSI